ncbi:acyltransferase [Lapillicoccus sp.]|uniref:acyltransferase n=1 Tax=Lapillicoccus sp. TaxID=1909287 RepID=UPI003263E5CF
MMINETSKRKIPFQHRDARTVGEGCYYMDLIVWLNGNEIDMGDEVKFNYGCYVNGYGGMCVGDRTGFGPYVMIHTANHVTSDPHLPILEQGWKKRPVAIGADCWIGMGVCILPGVTIGDRVIVGAGSVVTHDLPSNSLAVGNPAKVIRSRPTLEES